MKKLILLTLTTLIYGCTPVMAQNDTVINKANASNIFMSDTSLIKMKKSDAQPFISDNWDDNKSWVTRISCTGPNRRVFITINSPDTKGNYLIHFKRLQLHWLNDSTAVYRPGGKPKHKIKKSKSLVPILLNTQTRFIENIPENHSQITRETLKH